MRKVAKCTFLLKLFVLLLAEDFKGAWLLGLVDF